MKVNAKNNDAFRTFLIAVRIKHGLDVREFSRRIGISRAHFYAFLDGACMKGLSTRTVARNLSLDDEIVSALLDPNAQPIKFPTPESIVLPKLTRKVSPIRETLIDIKKAQKILSLVEAAEKPIPLATLLRLIR